MMDRPVFLTSDELQELTGHKRATPAARDLRYAAAALNRNPEVLRRNLDKWGVPYTRYSPRSPYVFTDEGLQEYLRRRQAPSEEEKCRRDSFINEKAVVIGTSAAYAKALGLQTETRPKRSQQR